MNARDYWSNKNYIKNEHQTNNKQILKTDLGYFEKPPHLIILIRCAPKDEENTAYIGSLFKKCRGQFYFYGLL